MEGEYKAQDVSAAGKNNNLPSSLSWSNILKGSILENRKPGSLSYYVKFYLRHAKRLEGLTWPSQLQSYESEAAIGFLSTSDMKNDPADAWKGKEFNIALITHRYPARLKYSLDKEKQWAFDVEVVLLPYNLLIHQDNDVRSTTLIPPLQDFDFSSRRVEAAMDSPDVFATHQPHRLEQLGSINTHASGSNFANSGCLIGCSVCCLVKQRCGLKKVSVQSCCTLSASLVTRGCSVRAPISGSYCATKEEHWARLSDSELQKIVLAFNWRSIEFSQVCNTGDWCLLPSLGDKVLPFNSSELSFSLERVEIDAKQPLISLEWKYAVDFPVSQADKKTLEQVASSRRATNSPYISLDLSESNMELAEYASESEEDTRKLNLRRCSTGDTDEMNERTLSSKPQLVDVVLTLPNAVGDEFRDWLSSLKRRLIPETLSVSEVLRLTTHPATISSLQGEVVSILGKLEAVECTNDSISTGDDGVKEPTCPRFSARAQRQTTLFQLRDLCTKQLIRIQFNFDRYVRPFGFGPGAVACFRRILLRRDVNLLVGVPTTDVLIESVEERLHVLSHKNDLLSLDNLPPQNQEDCAENANVVDLLNDLICELEPRKKCLKVHCRVVSVQELELEWRISGPLSQGNVSADTLSVRDDKVRDIAVKWGCFIIDDGSAVAECWANGDMAAKLLGLYGSAGDVSTFCPSMIALAQLSSDPSENQAGLGESLLQVLRSVVRRHKRVCVHGELPQGDTGTTSWVIKGVDGDLEESEAMILRFVLEQACQRGPKVVHCTNISEEDSISKFGEEYHRGQTLPSASTTGNSKTWQNLTWNRTQLFATKVEVLNTWAGLQQLASSFGL
ncbi:hypothetical protein KC19_10G027600 [Ceratodon purpureus]|uniref:CST complex subunit CTC1 n=1 Tax=Ceratodon purpureus TaxID=3225 RepID=A0A8T0GJS6_CERPU|nr:hypothetical protein KC19_10G027600 [Ceratodon purpureus]